jgi:hypothetical protein
LRASIPEKPTPNPSGLAVYYPFTLVEFLSCAQADEYEETGEILLVFLDQSGCRVTLKVDVTLLAALAARLADPPDGPAVSD